MTSFVTQRLNCDGLQLALHLQKGEGPVVFFQHGLCGDAAQPASVFPDGTAARLAVLECRGHGESPAGAAEKLSIAGFTDDVAAAMPLVAETPCMVGGISMGAAIALRLACIRPELVSALVLARPAWTVSAAPDNMKPNLQVGQILAQPERPGEWDGFLASETGRLLAREAPDNLASLRGFFSRAPRAVTAELLCRISCDGPGVGWEQVKTIAVPTLVIAHDEDVIHPLAHARALAEAIPRAQFLTIPPKTRGKEAYEAAFRAGLGRFIQETLQ